MGKKVLVTSRSFGNISDEPYEILREAGLEVTKTGLDFDQAEFERTISDYDALIIGAHPFPPEVLERCDKLQIICKHGVGLDNIPLEKAKENVETISMEAIELLHEFETEDLFLEELLKALIHRKK